jgi:hypothetical protein
LHTTRIFHELFKPEGVKNNYGILQGPMMQLSLHFIRILNLFGVAKEI